MRVFLENDTVKMELESFGAEIKSLVKKECGQELMWSADSAFWGKTAPFLFPFIGKLQDEKFVYEGKEYPADKHGFGQRVDYEIAMQEEDRVVFRFVDNDETYAKYPFHFELDIEYVLLENGVRENWYVKNTGEKDMHFSVGGHAAFACPAAGKEGLRTGQKVKLYGAEHKSMIFSLTLDGKGLVTDELRIIDLQDGSFSITKEMFEKDALIFDGEGITAAALCDENGEEYVRVECNAPVWGIWSHPDEGAGYVCLEPWYGICDYAGFEGVLKERPYTQTAKPGETWEGYNTIRF